MATIKQYTSAGAAAADLEIDDSTLVTEKGAQALKDAVTAIRNAMRAGSAHTKSKGEVAGSNKKPWKQKGTGRARAGFRQSPVWRGGGVAHGPKARDWSVKVNKKVMKLAFARAVAEKIVAGDVIVVSEFKFEAAKTKLMNKFLKSIGVERSALVLTAEPNEAIDLMVRNLPRVDSATAQEINPYAVLLFKNIVADKAGFDALMARAAATGKEAK
jgi:large subunit ribosomal protein L4